MMIVLIGMKDYYELKPEILELCPHSAAHRINIAEVNLATVAG